jgi:hypothetical protein
LVSVPPPPEPDWRISRILCAIAQNIRENRMHGLMREDWRVNYDAAI